MQLTESKKTGSRQWKATKNIGRLQFSPYGLIYRVGKIEADNLEKRDKKRQPDVIDFADWCMPEQPVEYIKCKKHDFL